MLSVEPRSGYEIKAMADKSARFFWAASYGQIYPELKRLTAKGLIEAEDDPHGGRNRTVHRITPAGREAMKGWIAEPGQTHELRDEGLLKLFFAGMLGKEEAADVIRKKRDAHVAARAELEAIEPFAATAERVGPYEVLQYGLGFNKFAIEWCEEMLKRIEEKN